MEKNVLLRTTIATLLVCIIIAGLIIYYIVLLNPDSTPAQLDKILISTSSNTPNVLIYIAEQHHYFAFEGLDVDAAPYETQEEAFSTLQKGESELCVLTNDIFAEYALFSKDMQILCTLAKTPRVDFMVHKDFMIHNMNTKTVKKVGVPDYPLVEYYLDRFILYNKFIDNELELSYDSCENIIQGFINGSYDGALIYEPYTYSFFTRHQEQYMQVPGSNSRFVYYLLVARTEWVNTHPDQAEGILRALVRAEEWFKKGNEHTLRYVAHTSGASLEHSEFLIKRHQMHIMLPKELLIVLEDQTRWLIDQNDGDLQMPNYLKYIYFKPLKEVSPERVEIVH